VHGVQGDASDLSGLVADGSADVVLCHGVLEVVDDPEAALVAINTVLRPDGLVSVLVANRLAAVLTRALSGHFEQARAALIAPAHEWDPGLHGARRYARDEVIRLLGGCGFSVQVVQAVRVFTDLVPSTLVDASREGRQHCWSWSVPLPSCPSWLPWLPSCTCSPAATDRRASASRPS
jgi:SAM-dependent methyltransferase